MADSPDPRFEDTFVPAHVVLTSLENDTFLLKRVLFPPGGDGADVLGRVRAVETSLAEFRRGAIEELEDDAIGTDYELLTTYPKDYSFNWVRILRDVANNMPVACDCGSDSGLRDQHDMDCASEAGADLLDAFMHLVDQGAVEMNWKVGRVRKVLGALDVPVVEVSHELDGMSGDLEEPHIGYVQRRYQRIAARKEKP